MNPPGSTPRSSRPSTFPWLGEKAALSRTATAARLLWDREYLYFHAEMEDTDLFADIKEHDGRPVDQRRLRALLPSRSTKPGYYEFQVNAAGAVFDAFFPAPRRRRLPDASRRPASSTSMPRSILGGTLNIPDNRDTGWTVEGRIPWTDFVRTGGRPVPGEEWKFNLCRFDYHADWKEPELSTWLRSEKKTASYFHQIEDYATLTFVGPDAKTRGPTASRRASR